MSPDSLFLVFLLRSAAGLRVLIILDDLKAGSANDVLLTFVTLTGSTSLGAVEVTRRRRAGNKAGALRTGTSKRLCAVTTGEETSIHAEKLGTPTNAAQHGSGVVKLVILEVITVNTKVAIASRNDDLGSSGLQGGLVYFEYAKHRRNVLDTRGLRDSLGSKKCSVSAVKLK
jgi:hypothetical protein